MPEHPNKFHQTMREFGRGSLRTPQGRRVTNPHQARAIAFSQQRRRGEGDAISRRLRRGG